MDYFEITKGFNNLATKFSVDDYPSVSSNMTSTAVMSPTHSAIWSDDYTTDGRHLYSYPYDKDDKQREIIRVWENTIKKTSIEDTKTIMRKVQVYIIDPTDLLEADERLVYVSEPFLTDDENQDIFYGLNIPEKLIAHNAKRAIKGLDPVKKMRDLHMHVQEFFNVSIRADKEKAKKKD